MPEQSKDKNIFPDSAENSSECFYLLEASVHLRFLSLDFVYRACSFLNHNHASLMSTITL